MLRTTLGHTVKGLILPHKKRIAALAALVLALGAGVAVAATVIHVEIPFGGTVSTVVSGTCTTPSKNVRTCTYTRSVAIPYTGTAVTDVTVSDTTTTTPPPANTIDISTPAPGSTVSGSVQFRAVPTGAVPDSVIFTIDGGDACTELQDPYVYCGDTGSLNTTKYANGNHTLAVVAHYSDGSTAIDNETVTVSNIAQTKLRFNGSKVVFAYGDSYNRTLPSPYEKYDVVVVGYGNDGDVANLSHPKALTYKTQIEIFDCVSSDACLSGISYQDALAAGVLLKDLSGNVIQVGCSGACGGSWYALGDYGSQAYQDLWVQKVTARLASKPGLDGVYIDNAGCDTMDGVYGFPPKYPDFASQRAASLSFIRNVSAQLQARGYYVIIGTGCGSVGDTAKALPWWTDVAPYPNGTLFETFLQNPCGCYANSWYDNYFESPTTSWLGHWKDYLGTMDIVQNAGTDFYAITSVVESTAMTVKYSAASWYLKWDGVHGGFGHGTGGDSWDPNGWAFPLGTPTGTMQQSGVAYYRTYTGGKVIVNPDPSQTVIVLGVALAPKTAYIGA